MAFARYEKLDLIGRSHIGEVWRYLDSRNGRTVAALRLTDQVAGAVSWDEAWANVLHYFREFRHEYVVQAIDTDPEQRLVLMELMADSMRSVLNRRERIQADLVRRCLRRCLEALADLHPRGLIHGDVRPDQLLFNSEGRFRLSFSVGLKPGGVVILREDFNQYFAPELMNPEAGPVGHQVDLYALGIAAYEMLVGTKRLAQLVPGVGENAPEPQKQWMKWQADLKAELPKLTKIFGNVPADLAAVIDGLVRKRTSERFATADEALALLETEGVVDDVLVPISEVSASPSGPAGPAAVLTDGVVSAYASSGPYQPGDRGGFARENPPTATGTAAAVPPVVAVAGSGLGGSPRPTARPVAAASPPPGRAGRPRKTKAKRWLVPVALLLLLGAGLGTYGWRSGTIPALLGRKPARPALELSGTLAPPDATLTINKKRVQTSDGKWTWSSAEPAAVAIEATRDGYEPWRKALPPGEKAAHPIAVALTRSPVVAKRPAATPAPPPTQTNPAAVELAGTLVPPDAELTVNETRVEVRDGHWKWSSPEPVAVTVAARRPGYRDVKRTLDTTDLNGDAAALSIVLERLPALELAGTLDPPDANLTINGARVKADGGNWTWSSPEPVEVAIEANRDGYEPWRKTLSTEGRVDVPVALKRIPAIRLKGTLDPPDAELTANDAPVAVTGGSWEWSSVEPIEVTLKAAREGYAEQVKIFAANARSTEPVDIALKRLPVMELTGTLDPPDATLMINDVPVATEDGAWKWASVSPKPARLRARHAKFADWERTVSAPGRSTIAVVLDPIVSIMPPDATVTVDGEKVPSKDGKVALRLPPQGDAEVSLSRGDDAKTFTLDRRELAELNYALTLPAAPPPPVPQPLPAPSPLPAEFDAATAKSAQEAWAASLGVPVLLKNSIGMELALVPPGRYTIGADPSQENRGNALPAQPAAVEAPLFVSTTEVTQAQWLRVMGTRPWDDHGVSAGDDFPAVYVSWDDASEFCRRLTAAERAAAGGKAQLAYRLPTESEWEWACRAGSRGRFTCPDGEIKRYGWFDQNVGDGNIQPVGRLSRNRFGLCDVHGNAAEWCADVFISRVGAGEAPAPGKAILRGGSWNRTLPHVASASRDAFTRERKTRDSGFRVVIGR